jgi:hypothetical protein
VWVLILLLAALPLLILFHNLCQIIQIPSLQVVAILEVVVLFLQIPLVTVVAQPRLEDTIYLQAVIRLSVQAPLEIIYSPVLVADPLSVLVHPLPVRLVLPEVSVLGVQEDLVLVALVVGLVLQAVQAVDTVLLVVQEDLAVVLVVALILLVVQEDLAVVPVVALILLVVQEDLALVVLLVMVLVLVLEVVLVLLGELGALVLVRDLVVARLVPLAEIQDLVEMLSSVLQEELT